MDRCFNASVDSLHADAPARMMSGVEGDAAGVADERRRCASEPIRGALSRMRADLDESMQAQSNQTDRQCDARSMKETWTEV